MGGELGIIVLVTLAFSSLLLALHAFKSFMDTGSGIRAIQAVGCAVVGFVVLHAILAAMVYKVILF